MYRLAPADVIQRRSDIYRGFVSQQSILAIVWSRGFGSMVDHGHAHEGPRYFKEPMGDQNLSLCTKTTRTVLTGWMQPRGSQRAHHIGHTWLTIKHKGGDHRRTISYTIIAIIAHWIHRLPALFYLNSFFLFAKQLDPNLFSLCLLAFFPAYSVAVEIWWFCPLKKLQHGPKTILLFAIPSLSPRRRTALWEYSAQRANKRQWQVRAAHEKNLHSDTGKVAANESRFVHPSFSLVSRCFPVVPCLV